MNPTLERLFRLSARSLSDSELLQVLLDSDALNAEDLRALARTPHEDWLDDARLSHAQAARLLTALELARRFVLPPSKPTLRLRSPQDIYAFMRPHLMHLAHEEMHVLCLSPSNVLLKHRCVAKGTATQCTVDPREVFHTALQARAAAVVLVHNHPSGDATPSADDVALTRQLVRAGHVLSVRITDHLVVGDLVWTSMLAEGLIEPAPSSRSSVPAVSP